MGKRTSMEMAGRGEVSGRGHSKNEAQGETSLTGRKGK